MWDIAPNVWWKHIYLYYIIWTFLFSFWSRLGYQAQQTSLRSSRSQMIFKIGVIKTFANFTQKHLCWSLILIKLQAFKRRCFPLKFAKYLRTPILKNICKRLLLDYANHFRNVGIILYFTINFSFVHVKLKLLNRTMPW